MRKLKNTPWKYDGHESDSFTVFNSKGVPFAELYDEPTARAIAALPETLERLERLEEALIDIKNWDEDLEDKWVDQGYRALKALEE